MSCCQCEGAESFFSGFWVKRELRSYQRNGPRKTTRWRMTQRHGDFVELASELEPADIVTFDRVICCYHDYESLVRLSTDRARRLYGVVYPRYTWLTRAGHRFINLFLWLLRNPFRVFTHPTREVDVRIRDAGFRRSFQRDTLTWQVVLYER